MALKRKTKIEPNFSMASMTDIIFLLLIFFMLTSTAVVPNAIKILLPQSHKQTAAKQSSRISIDKNLNYYVAFDNQREKQVAFDDIIPFLKERYNQDPEMYIALYADEVVPYREIVKMLDIVNKNNFKMVLVTRPPNNR